MRVACTVCGVNMCVSLLTPAPFVCARCKMKDHDKPAEASGHGLGMPEPMVADDPLALIGEKDRHEVLESFAEILDHRNNASDGAINGVFIMGKWQDAGPVADIGDSCIEVRWHGLVYTLRLARVQKIEERCGFCGDPGCDCPEPEGYP